MLIFNKTLTELSLRSPTANKQTQSAATKIGKNLATTPQHQVSK